MEWVYGMLGLKLSISSSQGSYKKVATLKIELNEDLLKWK